MSKKAHVVMKVDWEYNDEFYYRPQSEGGNPIKVYTDPEKAKTACREQNLEAARSRRLLEYCDYDTEGWEKLPEDFRVRNDLPEEFQWDLTLRHMSDEDLLFLMEALEIKFFEVEEVPLV